MAQAGNLARLHRLTIYVNLCDWKDDDKLATFTLVLTGPIKLWYSSQPDATHADLKFLQTTFRAEYVYIEHNMISESQ